MACLLALLLICGCGKPPVLPDFNDVDYAPHLGQLPAYGDVVARYNANIEHATRLWSKASLEFYYVDAEGRRQREFADDSTLIMVLPDQVALSMGKLGETGFWLGSDGQRYWLFDLLAEPETVYVGSTQRLNKAGHRELPIPIQPRQLGWLLGLRRIDPSSMPSAPAVEWLAGGYLIEPPGEGVRLLIDPATGLIRRVMLLDAAGRPAVTAVLYEFDVLDDDRLTASQKPLIPYRVEAALVNSDDTFRLRLKFPSDGGRKVRAAAFKFDVLMKQFKPKRVIDLDADA